MMRKRTTAIVYNKVRSRTNMVRDTVDRTGRWKAGRVGVIQNLTTKPIPNRTGEWRSLFVSDASLDRQA